MRKYWIYILLVIVIIILLGYTVGFKYKLKGDNRIIGTFCTNPSHPVSNTEYLVFTSDDTYCIYKQGEKILEEGTYKKSEDIILLTSDNKEMQLVYDKITSTVYRYKEDIIYKFYKISDVPTYINVKE